MTFLKAVDTCLLDNFFVFRGRASRSEFWYFMLFQSMLQMACAVWLGHGSVYSIFLTAILAVPTVTAAVRRLHDINRPGWWLLLLHILPAGAAMAGACIGMFIYGTREAVIIDTGFGFIAGYIVMMVRFFCRPGTEGENSFGPDPEA